MKLKDFDNKSFPLQIDEKFNNIAKEFIKNNKINYISHTLKRLVNIIFILLTVMVGRSNLEAPFLKKKGLKLVN